MNTLITILIDIGFYLHDNWKVLSLQAVATFIGLTIGKRWGIRFAVNYIYRAIGIRKKEIDLRLLAEEVRWTRKHVERMVGEEWNGNTATSSNTAPRSLKRLFSLSRVVKNHQFIRRTRKMRDYLRKLGSRKFQSFIVGFITQMFILLKVDTAPYVDAISAGGLVITTIVYIWAEASVDKKGAKQNEPNYAESADTAA